MPESKPQADTQPSLSRRTLIGAAGAGLALAALKRAAPAWSSIVNPSFDTFIHIIRTPDSVSVETESGSNSLPSVSKGRWESGGLAVSTDVKRDGLVVSLSAASVPVKRIRLRWNGSLAGVQSLLGDSWERAYGDLQWNALASDRVMPWYFLTYDGRHTHGYGVLTGARSFCYWTADPDGVSLCIDVRCGGAGVQLGDRTLTACTVVSRRGVADESPFQATHSFCKQMNPFVRMPAQPVYGSNDWYYAYGNNTAANLVEDAKMLAALAPKGPNRPFAVVDDGWEQPLHSHGGRWDRGNDRFGSIEDLAKQMKAAGVRPGLWVRPLQATQDQPGLWRLSRNKGTLDPSISDVLKQVAQDITRIRGWGYELIKHDFTTYDVMGRWGFSMGSDITDDHWAFADRHRTSAEIFTDLYRTIRRAAGDAVVLGCNTVGHLSAGIFELSRIADDTSGREWSRIVKMGVNGLAFRGPQHGAFFGADADCAAVTTALPWGKSRQWLDLVSRSGTPLFVSFERDAVGPEQESALREALATAAATQPLGEPLDWMETRSPSHWRLSGKEVHYDWS